MGVKLNIGGGDVVLEGYTNVDRKNGTEAFPLKDYADGSVDAIRASHVLEHFPYRQILAVLKEWRRVLSRDGTLEISVPDFDKINKLREQGDPKWRHYLMGGQTDKDDFHGVAFDAELLEGALREAGFEFTSWDGDPRDTSSHPCSLNRVARKSPNGQAVPTVREIGEPGPDTTRVTKNIAATLCIPRIGWNAFWGGAWEALHPFGIPIMRHIGPFWGQGMQRLFTMCADKGCDWILSLDYDTLFNADMLTEMFSTMARNPEIHALAALMHRRSKTGALCHLDGKTELQVNGEPFRVDSAHFGCTLISVEHLKKMKKPWFLTVPDKFGEYGDDREDDDCYFWRRWKECGHTVYIHPNVRVGHIEEMVSQYDEKMEPGHVYVQEWRNEYDGSAQTRRKLLDAEERNKDGVRESEVREGQDAVVGQDIPHRAGV